jgi:transcriptional antiterminator RfaH
LKDKADVAWVVATTHPHSETIAIENLERQGFLAYCPKLRRRRSHARRVEMVLRPLFPGYVFVGITPSARWRSISSTMGVRALVRFGEDPATIAGAFVDELRAREVDGAVARPAVPFEVGQDVRIAGGAFDGLVARILELDEKDRIVVLLDVMNRGVKARLEAHQLTPAPDGPAKPIVAQTKGRS